MPSSFRAYAVDFDGDGRKDIWSNVADALGSSANYLGKHGWDKDQGWGFEVLAPPGAAAPFPPPNQRSSIAPPEPRPSPIV
jgi:membrane-bound lytic murein transglycosylase B